MPSTSLRINGTAAAAALGAGLAAALLSMLAVQKTSAALAVGFVAPLPIMIATLGFGPVAGLVAAACGAIAVGVFDVRPGVLAIAQFDRLDATGLDVLVFLASVAVPAWLMARAARLAPASPRPPKAVGLRRGGFDESGLTGAKLGGIGPAGLGTAGLGALGLGALGLGRQPVRVEERVLGTILALAVAFASVSVALDLAVAAAKAGGFAAFVAGTVKKAAPIIEALLSARQVVPSGVDVDKVALVVTWAQMPLMTAAEVVVLVFNLWLAARIAQASHLLAAPWPDVPGHLRTPRPLALVLAVALGLSFAGNLVGALGLIVSGALLMAFALQGLAVLHALTRGKSYRFPLLIIIYLTMGMLMPWLLVGYGLLGLVDTAFAFRDRRKPVVKKS